MKRRKGFTLLELIIVVIVIGILASIALPRYIRVTERARSAEARQVLGILRGSQIRYNSLSGRWAQALGDLDVNYTDPNYFTVSISSATEGQLARLTRNAVSQTAGTYYAVVGLNGNVSFTGCTGDATCGYLN